MAGLALDVADEADTAGVLLEVVYVEALVGREGGVPRRRVALDCVEPILRIKLRGRVRLVKAGGICVAINDSHRTIADLKVGDRDCRGGAALRGRRTRTREAATTGGMVVERSQEQLRRLSGWLRTPQRKICLLRGREDRDWSRSGYSGIIS